MSEPSRPWHALAVDDALAAAEASLAGLTAEEAASRRHTFGPNQLPQAKRVSAAGIVARQLADPLVLLLLAAAALSGPVMGEWLDASVIMLLVAANATIGSVQQIKARRSMDALSGQLPNATNVRRDGRLVTVPASELVPGDVIAITAGDRVPADLRIVESRLLAIDESPLTGESVPVEKGEAPAPESAELAERSGMAYASTMVTRGRAVGLVVATAGATEIGRIAQRIGEQREERTPFQRQLARFSVGMGIVAMGLVGVILLIGWVQERDPVQTLFLAIALAVSAVPEGLVAISAIILARGASRMAERGAIARSATAIETIGSASVICTDKTGTLTENRMRVEALWAHPGEPEAAHRAAIVAALCADPLGLDPATGTPRGDPMELALVEWARALGVSREMAERALPRIDDVPFDASRKLMSTVHRGASVQVLTKGGIDEVLALCPGADASVARAAAAEMSHQGLRVLALADRSNAMDPWERELHLVGLVGLRDPLRPEVAGAIEVCRRAGIRVVMITGDHAETARAIAGQLGILQPEYTVVTGRDLEAISDAELTALAPSVAVYARSTADAKVRIVDAWHERGAILAMTGDGVNDGPALRAADVGCAMGRGGTDVAREASDLVLVDDNFATIVEAVREGRRTHRNLLKVIEFLLSTNIGEVVLLLSALLAGLAAPLAPAHVLLINLLTDGPPALALAAEPGSANAMRRPPRRPSIVTRAGMLRIAYQGAAFGFLALAAFLIGQSWGGLALAQTMTFVTLAMSQVVHSFSMRSAAASALTRPPAAMVGAALLATAIVALAVWMPGLNVALGLVPLGAAETLTSLGLVTTSLLTVESVKAVLRRRAGGRRHGTLAPAVAPVKGQL